MPEPLTPSKLWKRMTLEQRTSAARAFWASKDAASDHVQAAIYIAEQKKFRVKTVTSLDADRKAHHLASLRSLPDTLASRALVVYHLCEQRPMMSAFLDALGIAHENGVIEDDAIVPDKERLAVAAGQLADRFPPAQVALYLNTLRCQDPETWGALGDLPQVEAMEQA